MLSRSRDDTFWQYVAEKFHDRLKNDGILRMFFRGRSAGEVEMINFNIFRAGFGEDCEFYEDAIKESHKNLGITPEHVSRFLFVLKSVLIEAEIDDEEVKLMISRISVYGNIISQISHN